MELQCEIRVNWLLLRSFIQIPLKNCINSIGCKFGTITTFSSKKYKLENLWFEWKRKSDHNNFQAINRKQSNKNPDKKELEIFLWKRKMTRQHIALVYWAEIYKECINMILHVTPQNESLCYQSDGLSSLICVVLRKWLQLEIRERNRLLVVFQ